MNNSNTSTSSSTYQSEPGELTPSKKPTWLVSSMFLGGLLVFLAMVGGQEVSRWFYASANNALEEKRYDDAIETANRGLRWSPDFAELVALRAAAHLEQGDFQACLEDYDRMLEIAAEDDVVNERDIGPKAAKAGVLQRMKRYSDAIAIWIDIVEFRKEQHRLRDDSESKYAYALSLNNRAYTEAQAWTLRDNVDVNDAGLKNVDIKKSLADIRQAMELLGDVDDPIMIDTLGYLLLLNGEHDEALRQLNVAVERTRQDNEQKKREVQNRMQRVVDQRPFQEMLERLDQQYSVILHHRGEAYAAIGNDEQADVDITTAKQLGFDPDAGIW